MMMFPYYNNTALCYSNQGFFKGVLGT